MTQLVQSTKINYYQILGLDSTASTQQICQAYFFPDSVIATSPSKIIPASNILIKINPIIHFVRLLKHSMYFMTVSLLYYCRLKTRHLWQVWWSGAERGTLGKWPAHRQVQIHDKPWRSVWKILWLQQRVRSFARFAQIRQHRSSHFLKPVLRLRGQSTYQTFDSANSMHIDGPVQRLYKDSLIQEKSVEQRRAIGWINKRNKNHINSSRQFIRAGHRFQEARQPRAWVSRVRLDFQDCRNPVKEIQATGEQPIVRVTDFVDERLGFKIHYDCNFCVMLRLSWMGKL